jgi:restriction system protein
MTLEDSDPSAKDHDSDPPVAVSNRETKLTITQVIQHVMKSLGKPLTIHEAYEAIASQDLYQFKADDPVHIVRNEIRRHCVGLGFASASPHKLFTLTADGKYFILDTPVEAETRRITRRTKTWAEPNDIGALRKQYDAYLSRFRSRILDELKQVGPKQFERFCRNLLQAYGFRQLKVTRYIRDGGIDGHGRLKVGFDFFNVAFQCKRRTRGNVGRPEISQFRGDIQGQYEMGVFFTTAKFTPEAKDYSLRRGAVPVTLIDGPTIVDIMLDKSFGVEKKEELPVYTLALDLAFTE